MKTKLALDLKSLLLGATAAAVVIFGTGAAGSPNSTGHYEVSVCANGCAAVVNTVTGQVWTAHIQESNGQAIGVTGNNTFLTKKED